MKYKWFQQVLECTHIDMHTESQLHTHTTGMYIKGHFTFPAFSLFFFVYSFHTLLLLHLSSSIALSISPSVFPLCEGHAIDFPLSIHFSRLALKRGKQTKATLAPPLLPTPSLFSPPAFHLTSLSAGPRPSRIHPKGNVEECDPPPAPPPFSQSPPPPSAPLSSSLFLSLFPPHLSLLLLSGLASLSATSPTTFH